MTVHNRLSRLEEWDLPQGRFVFTKELTNGRLVFSDPDGSTVDVFLDMKTFEAMHADGRARRYRTRSDGRRSRYDDVDDVPPDGADDMEISRRFFCRKWDDAPCGKGDKALRAFVDHHAVEARKLGISWMPSGGALRRAINERGEMGRRPIRVMLTQTGKGGRQRWPLAVSAIMERCVFWFYATRTRDKTDAYARMRKYVRTANRLGKVRFGSSWKPLPTPSYDTLRVRIDRAASAGTWSVKYNPTVGRRRFVGTRNAMSASAPLDVVMIDSTVVDGWCVLDDRLGVMIPAGRPTLTVAVDLFSRTVLAVVLTFEPPSLYTIMACLQQVNVSKARFVKEHPEFAELWAEKWGKPDTVVVDNAWEQVGVSFQDACEDAGINVEWAPVKNPEYKPHVERIFDTFNKKLFHKLAGGVPFKPAEMKKLGLDPKKEAAIPRSTLELLIHRTLRDSYQFETHGGLGASPEAVWQAGIAGGREVIDDANFLAAAFGEVRTATLTRSGIRLENMRFHDPLVTTQILADLASTTPVRGRRTGSATARVKVKFNPADIGGIQVWNPRKKPRKGYQALPNVDARYVRGGLGRWHHARIRAWAEAEGLPFQTDDERWKARDRLRVETENAAPEMKFAAMRDERRMLDPPKPVVRGDLIEMGHGAPGISTLRDEEVPVSTGAELARGDGIPEKGPRRGRAKRDRKRSKPRAVAKPDAPSDRTGSTDVTPPPAMPAGSPVSMADLARAFADRTS